MEYKPFVSSKGSNFLISVFRKNCSFFFLTDDTISQLEPDDYDQVFLSLSFFSLIIFLSFFFFSGQIAL